MSPYESQAEVALLGLFQGEKGNSPDSSGFYRVSGKKGNSSDSSGFYRVLLVIFRTLSKQGELGNSIPYALSGLMLSLKDEFPKDTSTLKEFASLSRNLVGRLVKAKRSAGKDRHYKEKLNEVIDGLNTWTELLTKKDRKIRETES